MSRNGTRLRKLESGYRKAAKNADPYKTVLVSQPKRPPNISDEEYAAKCEKSYEQQCRDQGIDPQEQRTIFRVILVGVTPTARDEKTANAPAPVKALSSPQSDPLPVGPPTSVPVQHHVSAFHRPINYPPMPYRRMRV